MKPDGVAMEPTEAVGAEPSAQGMATDEMPAQPAPSTSPSPPSQPEDTQNTTAQPENPTAPPVSKEVNGANGKAAADPKPKAKTTGLAKPRPGTAGTKATTGPASGPSTSRPGTAPSHMTNGLKSSASDLAKKAALDKKKTTTTAGAPASAAATKRSVGPAAASTVRTQTKVADRKAVGVPRSTSATRPTNATWTAAMGPGTPTRRPPAAGPINGAGARPKTTASRLAASAAPKPSSTSATAKPDRTTVSKATRPATGLLMGTSKPAAAGSSRPAASRVGATAPSTGRTTTVQAPKPPGPAKKDVSRPATTAAARKPATSATTKTTKPDPPKATAASRPEPASKRPHPTKATDTKPARPKSQDPKPLPTRKAPPTTRPPATRQPQGKTPPASPSNKPVGSTISQSVKQASKPTQSVLPFTARPGTPKSAAAAAAAVATVAVTAAAEPEVAASEVPAPVSVFSPAVALEPREEVSAPTPQDTTSPSPPQSPLRLAPAPPQGSLVTVAKDETSERPETVPAAPTQPAPDQTLPQDIPTAVARATPSPPDSSEKAQLNMDEEEDEEREGSQQVSVSEMSGTQPTEESRPGSAGPAGSGWRAGGALLSELDSEEVSCSQQGVSELSAPGVLEGTESMDDLGDASLKGAIDMEGMSASAGSPDFEKVPDIPTNDFDDYDEDGDRVCDMEVGSERADDPRRVRHDEDEDDEDVEMASEGVTESGLESYGNADEDDFAEDERLDNLNQAPPAPLLPSALAAQWDQPNPSSFCDPWAQPHPLQTPTSPSSDPWHADMKTPTRCSAQPWLQLAATPFVPALHEPSHQPAPSSPLEKETLAPLQSLSLIAASGCGMSHSSTLSATELAVHSSSETSTTEELCDYNSSSGVESRSEGGKLHTLPAALFPVLSLQPELEDQDLGIHLEREDGEGEEAETLPANEVPGDPATAPTSNPSSSTTEDEASDTEGEAQLDEPGQGIHNATFDSKPGAQRCLSALEEGEETSGVEEGGDTPQSANSVASYAYDMTASNSNTHSTAESCAKSPGIFSLEELPEEAKDPSLIQELTLPPPQQQAASADSILVSNPEEQQYMLCGTLEAELGDTGDLKPLDPGLFAAPQQPGEGPRVTQPPYYSTVCENTENSLTGLNALPQPHYRRDHHPNPHCDLLTPPRLTCADLPPRSPCLQASPQLRRLERHQQQLLELQQCREQQGKPKEENDEEARKKSEQEKEIKKKEAPQEEETLRREEVEQRQQIMQWQQELEEQAQQMSPQQQPKKVQATVLLSPSSGLHTIYEALESDEEGKEIEVNVQLKQREEALLEKEDDSNSDRREVLDEADSNSTSTLSPSPDSPEQEESRDVSPECPPPLDLDWGKKVDIVQQLINQTLLLTGDGCSSLLLLPGGRGGTLSPLEASLWPNLLPPLTPPSATVTSVSSFSPEAPGQSPQGEWTVVELETHH
ncbi:nucleolar protein dao-5 [Salmo salar]|uniref:Nucleolar protein dao-5 n=1 Tax=Salmo salar TaxID=8030 RepID=A0A1S3L8R7_SALSA|nr:nucleolar protein dao-5 [Salmo salar]XP_045547226.1 nucleolar protein dao-5 [Salmo salar]